MLQAVGAVALKLLAQLVTEAFLRRAVVIGLERLVAMTKTTTDDELLQAAKDAWAGAEKK